MSLADASWLPSWLRRQFLAAHHDGRCVRLQLFHLAGKQRGVSNWSFSDPAATPTEPDLEVLVGGILQAAQEDASDLFGRQRYSLCAYYERRPGEVAESKTFTCVGGGEGDDDDVDSEGPNQRGLLTQLMRHNEANTRAVVASSQQLLRAQSEMVRVLSDRLAQSEAQRFGMAQMYEGMLSERHVRELATKEHEMKMRAFGEGLEKLQLLVPVAVNALAGRRILPEPQTIQDQVVGQLVESISQEQMEKLYGILSPEQMIVVVDMMKRRQEQLDRMRAESETKERERQQAAGNGATGATT